MDDEKEDKLKLMQFLLLLLLLLFTNKTLNCKRKHSLSLNSTIQTSTKLQLNWSSQLTCNFKIFAFKNTLCSFRMPKAHVFRF